MIDELEPVEPAAPPVFHVISSDGLLDMLRRVFTGEDPDLVYLEEYANAQREEVEE